MSLVLENMPTLDLQIDEITIYSLGYEGLTIEGFLQKLRKYRIERIIDVRKNPLSRKPGFSKKSLSNRLYEEGIDYCHFPQLGIPSDMRQSLKTLADYRALFDRYEEEILPYQQPVIEEVIDLLSEKPSALLCFEAMPLECHRTRLSEYIERQTHFPHCYIR